MAGLVHVHFLKSHLSGLKRASQACPIAQNRDQQGDAMWLLTWGVQRTRQKSLLRGVDQGPRHSLHSSKRPSVSLRLGPSRAEEGAAGSAWLGVKAAIGSSHSLAFLVRAWAVGRGWRGSSDCDFLSFLLFSNFLSTGRFMCRHFSDEGFSKTPPDADP